MHTFVLSFSYWDSLSASQFWYFIAPSMLVFEAISLYNSSFSVSCLCVCIALSSALVSFSDEIQVAQLGIDEFDRKQRILTTHSYFRPLCACTLAWPKGLCHSSCESLISRYYNVNSFSFACSSADLLFLIDPLA